MLSKELRKHKRPRKQRRGDEKQFMEEKDHRRPRHSRSYLPPSEPSPLGLSPFEDSQGGFDAKEGDADKAEQKETDEEQDGRCG
jgi:hypothetical protein